MQKHYMAAVNMKPDNITFSRFALHRKVTACQRRFDGQTDDGVAWRTWREAVRHADTMLTMPMTTSLCSFTGAN